MPVKQLDSDHLAAVSGVIGLFCSERVSDIYFIVWDNRDMQISSKYSASD